MNDFFLTNFKSFTMAKSNSGMSFFGAIFRLIALAILFHVALSMTQKGQYDRDSKFIKNATKYVQKQLKNR